MKYCHFFGIMDFRLIGAGKHQVFIKVAHGRGNLLPVGLLFGIHRILFGNCNIVFEPTAVPMDIEQNVHVIIHAIAHHFFYPVHPICIDTGGFAISNMVIVPMQTTIPIPIPGNRETNSVKPLLFYKFHIILCNDGVAPSRFSSGSFHGVAYVPAQCNFGCQLDCIAAHTGSIWFFGR